ncbi:flagellar biosynthesis protein [uncultured Maritimibacter sp.]|jgi:flagellar assembly protein FliH|uniref:flagellar biosynthesis protein n=1 Tax=uncultured Maritimibacter sp. TaxID=991866 RepID=UPI00260B1FB1|nr:flagellar biosynthesis protein [uncultured Maritimibacter sp.]
MAIRLEDFSEATAATGTQRAEEVGPAHVAASASPDLSEKQRLAAYEDGYRAGWDDAIRQETENQARIGAEFARNLEDLGFTFHEARSHVMLALEPLLLGMIDKVLPSLVSDTLGKFILEELLPIAAKAADTPIEVVVHPNDRAPLERLLGDKTAVPFEIREEPTLAEGQVFLRSGRSERKLDLPGVVDRIGEAIRGLYELNEKAFQNG